MTTSRPKVGSHISIAGIPIDFTPMQHDNVSASAVFKLIYVYLFTDGGRRNQSSASAAWVSFIIINGCFKLAGHGGHFLTNTDSFQTETIAVEMALKHWATLRVSETEFSSPVKPWPNINLNFSIILTPTVPQPLTG